MRFLRRLLNLRAVFLLFFLPAFAASAWLLPTPLPVALSAGHALSAIAALCTYAPGNAADLADGAQRLALQQPSRYPVAFLNDRARDITGATVVNAAGFVVPEGLTGEGQIVAIADSGLDMGRTDDIHPDLRSSPGKMPKVVLLRSWTDREVPDDPDGHGTHMAATIAGTGAASNGKFRGVAPGASIYFQSILNKEGDPELPVNLADLFWPAYSAGARVHVNGWGGGPNSYLGPAVQVDDFVRKHPDFLVVFGAGNNGPSARSITAEANSKNALAVGASVLPRPAFVPGEGDTSLPADFSSRGPTGDGRIKPELLAPGSAVISARSRQVEGNLPGYPDYTRLQGTSMAAAVAGGSSTLLREYFKKYQKTPTPSAALVKAALINGSRPTASGPSQEGFGVIDLAGTLIALKEGTFRWADEWAGVSPGNEVSYTYRVSDTNAPFKATLAWTDPPAEPGAAQTLVNDLDLIVQTPDGRVFHGNHFLGKNTSDRTNNVEQVYLPTPVSGEYTIRVVGSAVRWNTVRGSSTPIQDYALVWGQPPAEGVVEKTEGQTITLNDGTSLGALDSTVINLVNDDLAPPDKAHLFPGAAVFRTPEKAYLAARIWRAVGVKGLSTARGIVFTEMDTAARLGGYSLAADSREISINGLAAAPERLPPGVEISGVVSPLEQRIRQVKATYHEREGVISKISQENGQKTVYLAGTQSGFKIARNAIFSYEDSYERVETEDMPFGAGPLEELEEVLPGVPVRLRLAPSTGQVQYLAVKRKVATGTVINTVAPSGKIELGNGASYRMYTGAPVIRDRKRASFSSLKPGDHITAVLLPGTGETIGLVAYSNVSYGKIVDFSLKSRTLYLLDNRGVYRTLVLPAESIIYRWGVRTTTDAISTGCWVRITTDPASSEVWRLDIADVFYDRVSLGEYNANSNTIKSTEGNAYRLSGSTRFFKNGYPVSPEDLLPGEMLELEYTVASPPTGMILVSVNTRSNAPSPLLHSSFLPLQDRVVLTGKTSPYATVYLWGQTCSKQSVPVDESGRFYVVLPRESETDTSLTLVAVDRQTGGAGGRQVSIGGAEAKADYNGAVFSAFSGVLAWSERERNILTGGKGTGVLLNAPLTREEAVLALSRLFNWPGVSNMPLEFSDERDFPAAFRPAAAEARARNIISGYPDGSFLPMAALSRAEAAVLLAAVMRDLGLEIEPASILFYRDYRDIPGWAAEAVAKNTSSGLYNSRRFGAFAPAEPVTVGEMISTLTRLMEYCEKNYR